MRIAVLIHPVGSPEPLQALAKGLAEGFQANGHQVDIFNLATDDQVRVGLYDYVCVGTAGLNPLTGKVDPVLAKRLDGLTGLSGKRCFAFVRKKPFGSEKLLVNLMNAMEGQGMFMRNSAIFAVPADAVLTAKNLDPART